MKIILSPAKKMNVDTDLRKQLTLAVLSYEGIAYQYMAPAVFETEYVFERQVR